MGHNCNPEETGPELIEWIDAYGVGSDWVHLKDFKKSEPKPLLCKSIGWVLYEDDSLVVIVSHLTGVNSTCDQQACGDMTIPKVSIVKRRPVAPIESRLFQRIFKPKTKREDVSSET